MSLRGRVLSAALVVAACRASWCRASEEEFLPWRSFAIECSDDTRAGKVALSARAGKGGLESLSIRAFGKAYSLSAADLLKMKGYPLDSAKVTHEAGYAKTGGHTVHLKFTRRHIDRSGKPVEGRAVVSVSEGKGLAVSVWERE